MRMKMSWSLLRKLRLLRRLLWSLRLLRPPLSPTETAQTPKEVKVEGSEATQVQDPTTKDFPMVTQESQQGFKDKGQKVAKSDAAPAKDPPSMKRPAKKSTVAEWVEPAVVAVKPKKTERVLDEEFKNVADSDCEVVPSDDEVPVKPTKTKRGKKPQPKKTPSHMKPNGTHWAIPNSTLPHFATLCPGRFTRLFYGCACIGANAPRGLVWWATAGPSSVTNRKACQVPIPYKGWNQGEVGWCQGGSEVQRQ